MRKAIIFLTMMFLALPVFATEPTIKFEMKDGTTKIYNLKDIDTIGLVKNPDNYVMKIFYQNNQVAYYPTEVMTSIKFEKDSANNQVMNVYICGYPKPYLLSSIDSIYFYIDIYQPLTIGTQVWMLKNLNVDHYRNGDSIPEVRDSLIWINLNNGGWCIYQNSDSLGKIYGKLYNWFTINDSRGIAPFGWHVSSSSDWEELVRYLNDDYYNAAGKLKSIGTIENGNGLWYNPNTGATNETGFSALSGGNRDYKNGIIYACGSSGYWWTATEIEATKTEVMCMYNNSAQLSVWSLIKQNGFSVRCIKDK